MNITIAAQIAFENEMRMMAEANGFSDPRASFAITPDRQQRVVKELQEENNFLSRINVITVKSKKGQKIFLGSDKTGTYRGTSRTPKDLASNRATTYETEIRMFDTIIPYARIDQWHHLKDLLKFYRSYYLQQMADENAAISLRGVNRHADPSSLPTEEEKLINVDLGFGAIMAQTVENGGFPDHVFDEWIPGSGCIIIGNTRTVPLKGIAVVNNGDGTVTIPLANHGFAIGAKAILANTTNYNGEHTLLPASDAHNLVITAAFVIETFGTDADITQFPDFANLDHLASAGIETISELKLRELVVMLARDVMAGEEQKLWASQDPATPSEQKFVLEMLKSYGGLPGYRILGMNPGSMWITAFNNLSYYELEGSRRKSSKQDEERMGYADWNYCEATNVVEDVEKMIVFNNIKFLRKHRLQ